MNRPALIDKLCQPDKWVFRKSLIPFDDLAGSGLRMIDNKLVVDFSTMHASQMQNVVLAMVQTGGGISVDEGQLYVDFESMPTTKFDNLLKALHIPIWLTKNTTFYVDKDHAKRSDDTTITNPPDGTTDKDLIAWHAAQRGTRADKPFETIQACVNFVCNNYNVGPYTVTILVDDDTYSGPLTLGEFSRTTGKCVLQAKTRLGVKITHTNGQAISVVGGPWQLNGLDLQETIPARGTETSTLYSRMLNVGASLELVGCKLTHNNNAANTKVVASLTYVTAGGFLDLTHATAEDSRADNEFIYSNIGQVLYAETGGQIMMRSCPTAAGAKVVCQGSCDEFMYANGGDFRCSILSGHVRPTFAVASGKTCTGKCYSAVNGGHINTGNGGASFFPGETTGSSAEASTYSWYK